MREITEVVHVAVPADFGLVAAWWILHWEDPKGRCTRGREAPTRWDGGVMIGADGNQERAALP
jgi:hypothetical protein